MQRPWLLAAALITVVTVGCASTTLDTDAAGPSSAPTIAESDATSSQDTEVEPSSAGAAPADATGATEAPVEESGSNTIAGAAATSEAVPVDPVALVGGGQLDLGSIEGSDTVLWFWAPW